MRPAEIYSCSSGVTLGSAVSSGARLWDVLLCSPAGLSALSAAGDSSALSRVVSVWRRGVALALVLPAGDGEASRSLPRVLGEAVSAGEAVALTLGAAVAPGEAVP